MADYHEFLSKLKTASENGFLTLSDLRYRLEKELLVLQILQAILD